MTCELHRQLLDDPAWVFSIIGAGGSGKTSKAFWILDSWFPDETIHAFHFPESVLGILPERMRSRFNVFNDMRQIAGEPGIVLLDDVAIFFLSRSGSSAASRDLISTMTIGRHNGHRYLVTCQNSILMDKGLMESLNQYSIRCRMTELQTMTEREELRELQLHVNTILEEATVGLERQDAIGYCYSVETDEILVFPDWSGMTEELSKPYRGRCVRNGSLV